MAVKYFCDRCEVQTTRFITVTVSAEVEAGSTSHIPARKLDLCPECAADVRALFHDKIVRAVVPAVPVR